MTKTLPITNDTEVSLNDGEWIGSFANFCASNEFEDNEAAEIEAALNKDGAFEGGGGALAGFTLRVVKRSKQMFLVHYQARDGLISGTKNYPNQIQANAEAGRMRFCGYIVKVAQR